MTFCTRENGMDLVCDRCGKERSGNGVPDRVHRRFSSRGWAFHGDLCWCLECQRSMDRSLALRDFAVSYGP